MTGAERRRTVAPSSRTSRETLRAPDHTGTQGIQEFEVDLLVRFSPLLMILPGALALAVMAHGMELSDADMGGVLVVAVPMVALGVFVEALWQPYRVVVHDDGLLFVARCREMTIDWDQLQSVTRIAHPARALRWRSMGGPTVHTTRRFVDLPGLLFEVEARAPHAHIRV